MQSESRDGYPGRNDDDFIPRLYYFDFPGKGEAVRLLCAYAGIEMQDIRLPASEDVMAMKEVRK
jgi:hypothetical protein